MSERNLVNGDNNPVGAIFAEGARARKEALRRDIIPPQMLALHDNSTIHIHDMEYYGSAYTCIGVSVERLVGSKAGDFCDVCRRLIREIVSLTNAQSAGIGFINFDTDMAAYIGTEDDAELKRALRDLILDLNINLRRGCEKPYVSFNFGLDTSTNGRRVIRLLLEAFSEGDDGMPYIFPNLIFKLRSGVNAKPADPNFDMLMLSAKTTAACMMPTYFNADASYNASYSPETIGIMCCRSRLAENDFGEKGALYRGDVAVATINLVQLALESKKARSEFYRLLDDTMDSACDMLIHRFETLAKRGFFEYVRNKGLYLDSTKDACAMLKNGTLDIGFIGLWECVCVLNPGGSLKQIQRKGLAIVEFMRAKTDKYIASKGYNFSLLATPAEGVSGEFPEHDRKVYGSIEGVTDKGYYTNSFHVPVDQAWHVFDKID
ncbi:MAG: anaerobic ribonucleoside-triphosphate reductase, partial [Synergistaceae bacterium]|nr:anaerobic ribonucleoside-triphosphate reductase [Synergistaceae bacterium]